MEQASADNLSNLSAKHDRIIAFCLMFTLGVGLLLPWNAMVTAVDYFSALYPDAHISRVFSVAYFIPSLITLYSLVAYGGKFSPRLRISGGFGMFFLLFLSIPLLDLLFIRSNEGTSTSLAVTIALVAFAGVVQSVVQGSMYGVAGELPELYTIALSGGSAAGGLLVSFLGLGTKAVLPNTPSGLRWSTYLFFAVACALVIVCLICFHFFHFMPVCVQARGNKLRRREEMLGAATSEAGALLHRNEEEALLRAPSLPSLRVLGDIWQYACAVCFIYIVTLSIFPGYLAEDVHSPMLGDWYPLLLITVFNSTDLVGKLLQSRFSKGVILTCVYARILFYPLFALAVFGPPILRTEAPVIGLTSLLGLSNGWLTTQLMMAAPRSVGPDQAEAAGTVMVLFLVLGLALGSVSGWVWLIH